ncbi:hypothetical protein [Bacillus thuringiensis]|uniref:hypothetical protein n=1 Tax=Bacillus thuringiensis TaxID=1428 RepID=UPI000BFC268A|nr:hypothetical protein [Bacillus thuringiensis]PGT89809.1 hypothetical protein COD17_08655 [Bacillus thuringiensis]
MIGGIDPFKDFHKPSSYTKKRYFLIGFPLIGLFLTGALVVIYVGDAIDYVTTPKRWKRRRKKR